jgi:hypothetical protein
MNTVLQWTGVLEGKPNLRVKFAWYWEGLYREGWAWGYADAFEALGFTALILGPLQIQFDWDV